MTMTPFLELTDVHKGFPGVKALKGIHFSVNEGEVHGLVGENGAGKSTIIKIIMGVYTRDSGSMAIRGQSVNVTDVIHAESLGLAAVYQDLNLALDLSIGENFFLGCLPVSCWGIVDWKKVYEETEKTLKDLNIKVDPRERISSLSPALQEMVSIAKAVHKEAELVIFDEPTALLTNEEVEILFGMINRLKARGLSIIYISHRLEEIFEICDRVTVFRDGERVDTMAVSETDEDDLIRKMVGRSVSEMYAISHHNPGDVLLEVKNLSRRNVFRNISFAVHRNEIFGFFGLVGSGRTEIVRALFGADPLDEGLVYLDGNQVKISSPEDAINLGIGLLPEDRKEQGLSLSLPVDQNINIASYKSISPLSVVNTSLEARRAEEYIGKMRIKTPSRFQRVKNLSGGNQQKVVIGKWLCCKSRIFIFDEPTVGIDVGAKREIYKLMEELASAGNAVIIISSYLPEVMGLSDRMAVIYEGELISVIGRKDFTEETILKRASGIRD